MNSTPTIPTVRALCQMGIVGDKGKRKYSHPLNADCGTGHSLDAANAFSELPEAGAFEISESHSLRGVLPKVDDSLQPSPNRSLFDMTPV